MTSGTEALDRSRILVWLAPPNLQIDRREAELPWDHADRMLPGPSDTPFGEDVDSIQPSPSFGPVGHSFLDLDLHPAL